MKKLQKSGAEASDVIGTVLILLAFLVVIFLILNSLGMIDFSGAGDAWGRLLNAIT